MADKKGHDIMWKVIKKIIYGISCLAVIALAAVGAISLGTRITNPEQPWAYIEATVYSHAENITGPGWGGVKTPISDGATFKGEGNGLGFWFEGYYIDIYAEMVER